MSRYEAEFLEDMTRLGCMMPDVTAPALPLHLQRVWSVECGG